MPRSPAVSGGSRSPCSSSSMPPIMGAEGAVSGAAGSAAVSSAGAAGAADAAGSSFTLWLGADGCAADAAVLSASEDAESFFGVSVLFFFVSFLVLWAALVSPSHSRADGSTVRPAGWDASRAVVPKPPTAMARAITAVGHHLARRTARLLFWCSCIFLSHSACSASKLYSNAASRRRKCFFTFIVYTQSQSPVNVLRCLMRGVSWKFSTTADASCGKRTTPPYYCIQKKKR